MWIRDVPDALSILTMPEQLLISPIYPCCFVFKLHPKGGPRHDPACLQLGLKGNITSFPMNTDEILNMLEGHKIPQPLCVLSSVVSVTYIRVGTMPWHMLKSIFHIHQKAILAALQWLMQNNKCYSEYTLDESIMSTLPKDDIPIQILTGVCQETETNILIQEHGSYVPDSCKSHGQCDPELQIMHTSCIIRWE